MEIKHLEDVSDFNPERFVRSRIWETGNLHCNIYCFEPEQVNAIHIHPGSDEVVLSMHGTGDIVVDDERRQIREGHTVLVRAGVPHGFKNTGPSHWIVVVVQAPLPVEHVPVECAGL